jgi:hypothetical protein
MRDILSRELKRAELFGAFLDSLKSRKPVKATQSRDILGDEKRG